LKDKSLKKPTKPYNGTSKENRGDFQNTLGPSIAKLNSKNQDTNKNFLNGYLNQGSKQGCGLQKKNSATLFGGIQKDLNIKQDFMFDISQEISQGHSRKSSICSGLSGNDSISLNLAEIGNSQRNILNKANTGSLDNTKRSQLRREENSIKLGDYLWDAQDQLLDKAFAEILRKIEVLGEGKLE